MRTPNAAPSVPSNPRLDTWIVFSDLDFGGVGLIITGRLLLDVEPGGGDARENPGRSLGGCISPPKTRLAVMFGPTPPKSRSLKTMQVSKRGFEGTQGAHQGSAH